MERHVERGEGSAALALLPLTEAAAPKVADNARRVALLAARQTKVPMAEELRLMKARLRFFAADGTRPSLERKEGASQSDFSSESPSETPSEGDSSASGPDSWVRVRRTPQAPRYAEILEECLARLEGRDPLFALRGRRALRPPQHERPDQGAQGVKRARVAVALDRRDEAAAEAFARA